MILLNNKTQILILVLIINVVCEEMDSREKGELKNSFISLLKNIVDINEKRVEAMKELNNLQDFVMTKNTLAKVHDFDFQEDSVESLRDQPSLLTHIDMKSNLNLTLRRTYKKKENPANSINIIIPFNSFRIKSDHRNDENNRLSDFNNNDNDENEIMVNMSNDKMNYDTHTKEETRTEENYEADENVVTIYNYDRYIYNSNKEYDQNDNKNDNGERDVAFGTNYRKNWKSSCRKSAAKVCRKACVEAHKNGCMVYKCSRRAKKAFSKECKRSCRAKFLTGRFSDSE